MVQIRSVPGSEAAWPREPAQLRVTGGQSVDGSATSAALAESQVPAGVGAPGPLTFQSLPDWAQRELAEAGWQPDSTSIRNSAETTDFRFSASNSAFGASVEGRLDYRSMAMEVAIAVRPTGAPGGSGQTGPAAVSINLHLAMNQVSAAWGSRLTVGPTAAPGGGSTVASSSGSFNEGLTELLRKLADIAAQDGRKRITLTFEDPAAAGIFGGKAGLGRKVMALVLAVVLASEVAFGDEPEVTYYDLHVRGPRGPGGGAALAVRAESWMELEVSQFELTATFETTQEAVSQEAVTQEARPD